MFSLRLRSQRLEAQSVMLLQREEPVLAVSSWAPARRHWRKALPLSWVVHYRLRRGRQPLSRQTRETSHSSSWSLPRSGIYISRRSADYPPPSCRSSARFPSDLRCSRTPVPTSASIVASPRLPDRSWTPSGPSSGCVEPPAGPWDWTWSWGIPNRRPTPPDAWASTLGREHCASPSWPIRPTRRASVRPAGEGAPCIQQW